MKRVPLNPTATRSVLAALVAAAAILPLGGCNAIKPTQDRAEDLTMYDFSSALRWGDFDKAYDFVDPKTKTEHPLTDLDRERFKQVEVSGYEVMAKLDHDGEIDQQVKLDLINRNTQIPRSIVYHEKWHWDAPTKHWWLESGLPDISPQD
jgi:hypothetical protein